MTATHQGAWAGIPASGRPIRLTVTIHFPWDREARLFAGERVWFDRVELAADQAHE